MDAQKQAQLPTRITKQPSQLLADVIYGTSPKSFCTF